MLTDVRKACQGSEVQKACSGRLLDIDLDFHALLLCTVIDVGTEFSGGPTGGGTID